MQTAEQVDADRLRGGFYSPPSLVNLCLDRISDLSRGGSGLRLLEPSAGDGAFIRGLAEHRLRGQVAWISAIEVAGKEAEKSRRALRHTEIDGRVLTQSALSRPGGSPGPFDVAVGNPPFLRFQFVSADDRRDATQLGHEHGIDFANVGNLWIPITIAALTWLRIGGSFAFIVPTESLTGVSASTFRKWLIENVEDLRVDLFGPQSFPEVMQEVLIFSGRRIKVAVRDSSKISVVDHIERKAPIIRQHRVLCSDRTWSALLIDPKFFNLRQRAVAGKSVYELANVAKFTVSTVTGANSFFSVSDDDLMTYGLRKWSLPLLPRIRGSRGLQFNLLDHDALAVKNMPRWLLDFSADRPDPLEHPKAGKYIAQGEAQGLHTRFKTRIRHPWYRVPVVRPKQLLMSKRANRYPRVVLNEASAVTTDTIYQASIAPPFGDGRAVAASFHNSVTLFTAELEGRSLGGGVLELVPSQVGRLLLPYSAKMIDHFETLDQLVRQSGTDSEALIEKTDQLLGSLLPARFQSVLRDAQEARQSLMNRRLARTRAVSDSGTMETTDNLT